jgi:glucosamine-phosphate N-acetyltransferase
MRSSYLNNVNYGDIFNTIISITKPKKILEFGILDGFSIDSFIQNTNENILIEAYDIFEGFNGNHANYEEIKQKYSEHKNVSINYGNFYELTDKLLETEYDIIHIDVANTGDIYEFAIKNYLDKLSSNGIMILEGGSKQRDNVEWMKTYNKKSICETIEKIKKRLDININVIGNLPSITIIKRNKDLIVRELKIEDLNNGFYEIINGFTKNVDVSKKGLITNNLNDFINDNIKTLVIEYKNKIIGTGKLIIERKAHNNYKNMGHIEDVIIDINYRSKHLGHLIINKLLNISFNNNCYKTVLNCNKDNIDFYKNIGFQEKGVEMCIYN